MERFWSCPCWTGYPFPGIAGPGFPLPLVWMDLFWCPISGNGLLLPGCPQPSLLPGSEYQTSLAISWNSLLRPGGTWLLLIFPGARQTLDQHGDIVQVDQTCVCHCNPVRTEFEETMGGLECCLLTVSNVYLDLPIPTSQIQGCQHFCTSQSMSGG